jgi:DNA modification methylase
MRRPILNNSAKVDSVYEPFAGSGTTFVAAESTGRICLAMEIDPRCCDVIVERWQQFTGARARLDGPRTTFADVQGERKSGVGRIASCPPA